MRISDWSSDVCSSDLPFEGGSAEGHHLELGSESFIPGFEGQLVGAAAGESRDVTVSFPDDYQASHLAGKEAVFDVKVKEIRAPKPVAIDDRSEEHTSELPSLMRSSYAVFCLQK